MSRRKVLIATGGTGGHLFPAQALGLELQEKGFDVLFVGGGLKTNRYFKREKYAFLQIESATPFRGNIFKSLYQLGAGIWQSFRVLKEFQPDLIVGFGSYHSFPVLCAAKWKKSPIALFISDIIPGRVNRLFSRWALFSAVQFSEAGKHLGGPVKEVKMPMSEKTAVSRQEARRHFYLHSDVFTFLVFGGSQGSEFINQIFAKSAARLHMPFQVIHIAGKTDSAEALGKFYEKAGIRACVKAFEERMELAWSAADVAICRSGAATIAEQLAFAVPTLYIPFPQAMDDHQTKNAKFIEEGVGGAITCPETALTESSLCTLLQQMMAPGKVQKMKEMIVSFKQDEHKPSLAQLIEEVLK
jgi:UDP-N-acetylglucosamine--N-acetylmuramyl-(pentapeptide) pyrophosphoryl-undecaprenol N-acetylglucosamine transferase